MRRYLLALPFLLVVPLVAADLAPTPHDPPPPRVRLLPDADKPPTIDGKLDDEAWKAAPWSDDFVDIEGDKKPKPPTARG